MSDWTKRWSSMTGSPSSCEKYATRTPAEAASSAAITQTQRRLSHASTETTDRLVFVADLTFFSGLSERNRAAADLWAVADRTRRAWWVPPHAGPSWLRDRPDSARRKSSRPAHTLARRRSAW